jgi:hypothetical protein
MAEKWIQAAHLKEGAFTKQAKKAGMSVPEAAKAWENKPGKKGRRARLAETFAAMARRRKLKFKK